MAMVSLADLLTGAKRIFTGIQGRKNDGTYEDIKVTDKGEMLVQISDGITQLETAALSVTSTPIEAKAADAPLAGRKQLLIYPPATGQVFWGTETVTSNNGAPLRAGDAPLDFLISDQLKVYLVSDGTDRDVRVVESK